MEKSKMSNPIVDKMQEIGEAVDAMRKANDASIAKLEQSDASRAAELKQQSDRANAHITSLQKQLKEFQDREEAQKTRIEILEAIAERPKGTPSEQLERKHLQAWVKHVRGGMKDPNLEMEVKNLEVQVVESQRKANEVLSGTALQGGNAVPRVISQEIEKLVLKFSEILQNVNVVTSGSADYNELVTISGANGGYVAETGTRSQTLAPNIRKVTPTHGELYAFPRASNWSLQDLMFNVEGWLSDNVADTFAVSISTAIHSGNGSAKPTGMVNSAPTNVDDYASPMRAAAVYEYIATGSSPITTAPSIDDLIDLQVAVRRPYQPNAKWAMNSGTLGLLRQKKDTSGQYLWQPSVQVGAPDMLLGKPVFVWEDMAAVGSSALPIAYGDFKRAYTFTYIGGMSMIRDNVTVPGFTNFLTAQRSGGIPRNNDAVKFLKQIAS
jgi:HK97 family phage major capsid protein